MPDIPFDPSTLTPSFEPTTVSPEGSAGVGGLSLPNMPPFVYTLPQGVVSRWRGYIVLIVVAAAAFVLFKIVSATGRKRNVR